MAEREPRLKGEVKFVFEVNSIYRENVGLFQAVFGPEKGIMRVRQKSPPEFLL